MNAVRALLLDTEALNGLARLSTEMQVWSQAARDVDAPLYVSAVTVAEVTEGSPRDAPVLRALRTLEVIPVDVDVARVAGRLRTTAPTRRKPRDVTVDALVVATAALLRGPVTILTSDPGDLTRLATDLDDVTAQALGAAR